MDFYLDEENVISRLINEWEKYDSLVIAYDFDNTVYDYHNQGHTYSNVIDLLREAKEVGMHLIVYTASPEEKYSFIKEYLIKNKIPFDTINENPQFVPETNKSKIYFNLLLDDRAGLAAAYSYLKYVINYIKKARGNKNDHC